MAASLVTNCRLVLARHCYRSLGCQRRRWQGGAARPLARAPARRSEPPSRRLLATGAGSASSNDKVTIYFINRDGMKLTAEGNLEDSLLDVVVNNDLDIDGFGACEGTLSCSTCHLIFEDDIFKKLEPIVDEEMDMLDLAFGLTDTSRLGCQICIKKWMDGMTVKVPQDISDARQHMDIDTSS
uniref:2Fe-2S ferredoxin-type domain-containing protein n=1 Tax=Callorhinchus milii TaxID=7868 RepID=A0A4W3HK77_CALMI|eukprot:gi/632974656/ref/XP_007903799.1/ PREDICTED: adrenodoxin, mitochondrial [Callorhinchus milii]